MVPQPEMTPPQADINAPLFGSYAAGLTQNALGAAGAGNWSRPPMSANDMAAMQAIGATGGIQYHPDYAFSAEGQQSLQEGRDAQAFERQMRGQQYAGEASLIPFQQQRLGAETNLLNAQAKLAGTKAANPNWAPRSPAEAKKYMGIVQGQNSVKMQLDTYRSLAAEWQRNPANSMTIEGQEPKANPYLKNIEDLTRRADAYDRASALLQAGDDEGATAILAQLGYGDGGSSTIPPLSVLIGGKPLS